MSNTNLRKAKEVKDDEFYTLYEDIEKELMHYMWLLKDKVVGCPCDDESSNFVKFIKEKIKEGKIKDVKYSGYNPVTEEGIRFQDFNYDEVDVVITNPPFSQFREFIALLEEKKKEFIVIGNFNALTASEIFKMYMNGRIKLGCNRKSKKFIRPDGSIKGVNAAWFTNMDIEFIQPPLELACSYTPEKYPKYDNHDAINVNRTRDIPCDYKGVMGVPISFLNKLNRDQFEVLGRSNNVHIDGKQLYVRIYVKGLETPPKN